ncbi:hypothetical protein SKAU_G00349750, partial [Synaphobranchus kaupii]
KPAPTPALFGTDTWTCEKILICNSIVGCSCKYEGRTLTPVVGKTCGYGGCLAGHRDAHWLHTVRFVLPRGLQITSPPSEDAAKLNRCFSMKVPILPFTLHAIHLNH